MVDIRPSADSGGSDGTTTRVFLQDGQRKQFRAHLHKTESKTIRRATGYDIPVLLSPDACTRHFKKTIRTIVPADFDGNASVASYRITFLTEVEIVDFVI